MISAGESDVEIDRISSMHTSCLGFGPLIYKLEADDGFEELMDHCKTVWESVENQSYSPEKIGKNGLRWCQIFISCQDMGGHGRTYCNRLFHTQPRIPNRTRYTLTNSRNMKHCVVF